MISKSVVVVFGIFVCCTFARSTNDWKISKDVNGEKHSTMLADVAKEVLQRSSTTSQVLNLNLSNLLILLVLKAVVFGAGYLGQHGGYNKGRELDDSNIMSEGELVLALGYLMGDTCLYRAACEEPQVAREYLAAAEMILETMKLLPKAITMKKQYEKTVSELRKAIEYGFIQQCPPEYVCKKGNIKNFLREE